MINNLRDMLIRDEGRKLYPYTDTVGKITIGVGRNLTDDGISDEECNLLLDNDIARITPLVFKEWPWVQSLSVQRQAVVFNMAFNMGVEDLSKFVLFLTAMQAGNWNEAAYQMKNSLWYGEVGERGKRLVEQVITDSWV